MPKINKDQTPDPLRPFEFQGLEPQVTNGGREALCECPWCGKEKLSISLRKGKEGLARCLGPCQTGWNISSFLQEFHKLAFETTPASKLLELSLDRRIPVQVLRKWEIALNPINDRWMIPGYNPSGVLCNLYKRTRLSEKGEWVWKLLPTPGLGHHLHGMNLFNKKLNEVYVCEGPWDAMMLWYAMSVTTYHEIAQHFEIGSSKKRFLLRDANVIAVPGCGILNDSWLSLFEGKHVIFMYDNDHWGKNKRGERLMPAGMAAVKRKAQLVSSVADRVSWLQWNKSNPEEPNEKLSAGFDVRDALSCFAP